MYWLGCRNWFRWKEWRRQRQQRVEQPRDITAESNTDDDLGDVSDGELCVICLMRRRRSAFIPCGHLVCCPRCALLVERDSNPKCPVCRQTIRTSVRIYDSWGRWNFVLHCRQYELTLYSPFSEIQISCRWCMLGDWDLESVVLSKLCPVTNSNIMLVFPPCIESLYWPVCVLFLMPLSSFCLFSIY